MKTTALVIISTAIVLCGGILIFYERKRTDIIRLVLTAVMTAMAVAGRIIFAPMPGFKPVTAVVIITGMYLGAESGFMCGALGALVSNFYFGQGPWTPFQMFIWGIIGILAAIFTNTLQKEKAALIAFSAGAGIIFSLFMDIYTVIWSIGKWSWAYYLTAIASSVFYMIVYAVSNVLFVLVLGRITGDKLQRAIEKNSQSFPC